MAEHDLTVTRTEGLTLVSFPGAGILGHASVEAMADRLLHLADCEPPARIIFDFTAVRFLASRMLGVLVELTRRAQMAGGKVVLCGLRAELHRILRVTQLDRLLTFADSVEAAKGVLGAAAGS